MFSKLTKARDGVTKMALSPSETLLVTLFASGSMAVWSFPSLRLRRLWMFEDMPEYISGLFKLKLVLPLRKQSNGKKLMHYPLDVQWWTDSAVILKQAGGAVSLLDVTGRELRNLTHGLFEQLQPGSEITPAMSDMFLILEVGCGLNLLKSWFPDGVFLHLSCHCEKCTWLRLRYREEIGITCMCRFSLGPIAWWRRARLKCGRLG